MRLDVSGLIGIGKPESLLPVSAALKAFHLPVIAVSPGYYHQMNGHSRANILTTVPDLVGQAKVI